ncbi:MAG: FMN-binding protein [Candidatus Paceibacterota bacterium]
MRKFLASTAFVAVFTVYALYQSASASTSTPIAAAPTTTHSTPQVAAPAAKPVVAVAKKPKTVALGAYRDGVYTGAGADAYYGTVKVQVKIANGKIADVTFLDYPQGRGTSVSINSYAMPQLTQEAIQAQSANVNGVSGASATSAAFRQSLASALSQAKA